MQEWKDGRIYPFRARGKWMQKPLIKSRNGTYRGRSYEDRPTGVDIYDPKMICDSHAFHPSNLPSFQSSPLNQQLVLQKRVDRLLRPVG